MPKKEDNAEVVRQIRAREVDVKNFVLTLDKFLGRHLGRIVRTLDPANVSVRSAAEILAGLRRELNAAGLQRQLARIEDIYASELEAVKEFTERLGGKQVAFTDLDFESTEALINARTLKTSASIDKYLSDLHTVVLDSIVLGKEPDYAAIEDTLGSRLASNIETEVNTSLQAFNRTVSAAKAEGAGLTLFIYLGPDDKVTRPFCHEVLQRSPAIYERSEIDELDNGQGTDAMTYGGGYNCRHQWRPISAERAKDYGYDS